MIGRRTLVELLHMVIGVVGASVLAYGAIWSIPHARGTIWGVAFGVMVVVLIMGIRPLMTAWRADRDGRRLDG